jgi:Fur family transcriptional regulator, peroxide stress response regulator
MSSSNILQEKGIKPSLHRIKILDYLLEHKNHPTVDTIYRDIAQEIPTLSKTTIYNTLKIFQKHGVVQALTVEENEVRFDATTTTHAHFKCISCGKIYDIGISENTLPLQTVEGHRITESHVYYKGVCKFCQKQD